MAISYYGSAAPKLDDFENGPPPTQEPTIRPPQEESPLDDINGMIKKQLKKVAGFGYSLMNDGKLEEAKALFRGLITLDPTEPSFHVVLGSLYLAQKKMEDASSELDEALQLDPRNVEGLLVRGVMRILDGTGRDALADLTGAKMLDSEKCDRTLQRIKTLLSRAAQDAWRIEAVQAGFRKLNSQAKENPAKSEKPVPDEPKR